LIHARSIPDSIKLREENAVERGAGGDGANKEAKSRATEKLEMDQ